MGVGGAVGEGDQVGAEDKSRKAECPVRMGWGRTQRGAGHVRRKIQRGASTPLFTASAAAVNHGNNKVEAPIGQGQLKKVLM